MAARKPAAAKVQPTANPERGEQELTLGDVTYRLRPSHAAIVAIEKKTGKALLPLARAGNAGEISMQHLGIIAAELIKAGAEPGDDLTANVGAGAIEALIYEASVADCSLILFRCLLGAATGGRTAEGNVKAPA